MRRGLAAALLLASCSGGAGDAAARAVRAYDDALVKAFATGDASGMTAVAARKEADRVRILVDLKTNANLVLVSAIERFEVVSAAVEGDAGTVETRERWRYHDRRRLPADAPPGAEIASDMVMRYALVREEGRWKVASVKTVSNVYLNPPGPAAGATPGAGTGPAAAK